MSTVSTATSILTVVATILPLTAIFIQFMSQFYADREAEGGQIRNAMFAALCVIVLILLSGYSAGDAVKFNTQSAELENAIGLLQAAFVLLGIVMFLLVHDISQEAGLNGIRDVIGFDSPSQRDNTEEIKSGDDDGS